MRLPTSHDIVTLTSGQFLSSSLFLPIMVEVAGVDDIEMDVREMALALIARPERRIGKITLIRDILPKDFFDNLTQRTSISSAHVNEIKTCFEWKEYYELLPLLMEKS